MLRVVVAVVLAVALFGVARPAVEDARETAAERAVERELVAVERAIADLRLEAAVPPGQPGARRVVVLDLPERSFGSAGIEYVAIGRPLDRGGSLLAYEVAGRPPETVRIDADVRVERPRNGGLQLADGPLVIRTGGRHRIALEPVRLDGRRVVLARHLEGRPVDEHRRPTLGSRIPQES